MSGFVALMIWTMLYFWPTAVALNKKRANTGAVFMLNLFLGWTLIGWIVALVWAMTDDGKKSDAKVDALVKAINERNAK